MSDEEKPAEMVFSERAYKVVLALNAEYKCGMEGQPATEMIELAIAAAVAEEREACAQTVIRVAHEAAIRGLHHEPVMLADLMCEDIRARGAR